MKGRRTVIKSLVLTVLLLFVSLSAVGIANAQTSITQRGLTLSPLRSELDIAPGTSLDGELTVTNSTNGLMAVDFSAEEFKVINQQYDYTFTEESNVTKWVTFNPSEISLLAGESKKVSFTVGVPLLAEPGGRYISLFASSDTGFQDAGVNSRQRVVSLLYITVMGDVTRSGHLVSLTSPWLISDKAVWSVALQNAGTTHFRSRYSVQVKDLVWGGIAASSTGDALILPGTVRLVSDTLPAPQLPGIYKINYTIGLGDTPAVIETRIVLYIPLWATLLLTTAVTVLIYWLLRQRFSKR